MGRMEHRCGTRHPLEARVTLYARDERSTIAHVREASISGMYVEVLGHEPGLSGVIDVEMTVPGPAGLRTYRWQAMVVRRTETGLGLMFDRVRPPAIVRILAQAEAGLMGGPGAAVVLFGAPGGKPREL
jgi:hypothetical protein